MKAFVINLEKSVDRLSTFLSECGHLREIHVFKAVDGSKISFTRDPSFSNALLKVSYEGKEWLSDASKRVVGKGVMTAPEFGCVLSHRVLAEKLLDDDECWCYLILEDDVFPVVSKEEFDTYMDNIPRDADLVQLASSQWYPYCQHYRSENAFYSRIHKRYFNGTMSYVLTKSGARKIVSDSDGQVNNAADDTHSSCFLRGVINVIVPTKPLFAIHADTESTVQAVLK